jgi:hypothetical protein
VLRRNCAEDFERAGAPCSGKGRATTRRGAVRLIVRSMPAASQFTETLFGAGQGPVPRCRGIRFLPGRDDLRAWRLPPRLGVQPD